MSGLVRAKPRTIGQMAQDLAMFHPAALRREHEGWTRAQVTEVITRLLEHEIGLDLRKVGLNATFVQDLGMG
jgi:hypothetical protein